MCSLRSMADIPTVETGICRFTSVTLGPLSVRDTNFTPHPIDTGYLKATA